jgi:hypothetical protein
VFSHVGFLLSPPAKPAQTRRRTSCDFVRNINSQHRMKDGWTSDGLTFGNHICADPNIKTKDSFISS